MKQGKVVVFLVWMWVRVMVMAEDNPENWKRHVGGGAGGGGEDHQHHDDDDNLDMIT